jgi:hypothetical protein
MLSATALRPRYCQPDNLGTIPGAQPLLSLAQQPRQPTVAAGVMIEPGHLDRLQRIADAWEAALEPPICIPRMVRFLTLGRSFCAMAEFPVKLSEIAVSENKESITRENVARLRFAR